MSKKLLLLVGLLSMSLLVFSGCEDDAEEAVSPLVGTWALSNLVQDVELLTTTEIPMGSTTLPAGTSMGRDTLDWAVFTALGVEAVVVMEEDGSFSLSGKFPVASDTVYKAPAVVPLQDAGTWTTPEDMSTLLIDGDFYDLGGALTMDDPESPTMITMQYMTTDTSTMQFPSMANPGSYTPLDVAKRTLGLMSFTRQ